MDQSDGNQFAIGRGGLYLLDDIVFCIERFPVEPEIFKHCQLSFFDVVLVNLIVEERRVHMKSKFLCVVPGVDPRKDLRDSFWNLDVEVFSRELVDNCDVASPALGDVQNKVVFEQVNFSDRLSGSGLVEGLKVMNLLRLVISVCQSDDFVVKHSVFVCQDKEPAAGVIRKPPGSVCPREYAPDIPCADNSRSRKCMYLGLGFRRAVYDQKFVILAGVDVKVKLRVSFFVEQLV